MLAPPVCLAASSPWDMGRTGHRTASPCSQDSQSLSPPGLRLSPLDTCLCREWTSSDTGARSLVRASPMLSPQAGLGQAREGKGPKITLKQQSRAEPQRD